MNEVKSFITGFCLSILSFSLYSQASTPTTQNTPLPQKDMKISLFKDNNSIISINTLGKISKETISFSDIPSVSNILTSESKTEDLSQTGTQMANTDEIGIIEGLEDDEIININTEELIPIVFNSDSDISGATPPTNSASEKVALLPETEKIIDQQEDSPWVTAKGNLSPKNKLLPENINNNIISSNQNSEDDFLPYNVAEKIKQSIIFPIPEEILSDENLTPTFIKKDQKPKPQKDLKIIEKKKVEKENNPKKDGILDNLSNWLNKKEDTITETKKVKVSPIYNSQTKPTQKANIVDKQIKQTKMKNIGDLYEAIQVTQEQNTQKKILPSELKLTFNPQRAEISGQTLRWIKAFSEKTINNEYYLKINLNASTPTELQRKRLNLLYTILYNNGVDTDKVDTVFSQTGQDTFIIRLIKNNNYTF